MWQTAASIGFRNQMGRLRLTYRVVTAPKRGGRKSRNGEA